jgi:cytochrome c553
MQHVRTLVCLLAYLTIQGTAAAQDANPTRLQRNLMVCANCHGTPAFDYPTVDNYLVPRLGGQQPAYIVKALKAYRSRQRDHFFMRGIAAALSDEEMTELAAWFSAQPEKNEGRK